MNRLDVARKIKKISQDELAEVCGLSQWTISQIENKKFTPKPDTRKRIEKVLGKIDWLSTIGIRTQKVGELTSWEMVEQGFRKALQEINCLSGIDEKLELIEVARHYLNIIESDIKDNAKH